MSSFEKDGKSIRHDMKYWKGQIQTGYSRKGTLEQVTYYNLFCFEGYHYFTEKNVIEPDHWTAQNLVQHALKILTDCEKYDIYISRTFLKLLKNERPDLAERIKEQVRAGNIKLQAVNP